MTVSSLLLVLLIISTAATAEAEASSHLRDRGIAAKSFDIGTCDGDCEEDVPWVTQYTGTVRLNSGCDLLVHYYVRFACGMWEIYIYDILPQTPACTTMTMADVIHQVQLLAFNYLAAIQSRLPPNGTCAWFNIIRRCCWNFDPLIGSYGRYDGCGPSCCTVPIEVCVDNNGGITATPNDQATVCDAGSCGLATECSFICP